LAQSIRAVDSNGQAIATGQELARKSQLEEKISFEAADALEVMHKSSERYDLVIVDPPKLAPKRSDYERARSQMRRIAAASVRITEPGGLLVLCSCSSLLGMDDLQRAVALGGRDAGFEPIVLERLFQGGDHPTPAAFPDGLYLSALLLEVHEP
jgi:23S rRNA (cytosine1962-C5)-methyltransferase